MAPRTRIEDGPVVIGVDDSRSSTNAVRWGLEFAARHAGSVRLVRAYDHPIEDGWMGDGDDPRAGVDSLGLARAHLDDARRRAAESHPGLIVTAKVVSGSAAAALIQESQGAAAVIIGAHGANAFSTLVAGATTMNVATQAQCPVVAVPTDEARAFAGAGMVVGVDGSGSSDAALGFAFHEAEATNAPLTAAFAWMGSPLPASIGSIGFSEEELSRRLRVARERLEAWVDPWAQKFPDVDVTKRVMHEHPVRALAAASTGAQLLVVGCRGNVDARSLLLGSVSHGLLHLATSPVAVVHDHN